MSPQLAVYCYYAGWSELSPSGCVKHLVKDGIDDADAIEVSKYFENKVLQILCHKNATVYAPKLNRRQAAMVVVGLYDRDEDAIKRAILGVR